MAMSSHFGSEIAPCGRTVGGEHVRDDDDEGFVIDHQYYACGCRRTRHQFHDGSIQVKVMNHRGRVVVYEHSSMHEA
jgi:hypothetical protein